MNSRTFSYAKLIFSYTIIICTLCHPFKVESQATEDGLQFAQKFYDRDDGKNSITEADIILIESDGDEKKRSLSTSVKDYGKLSKTYIVFTDPQMIKGTAFLSWENETGDDDQFLFLPSIGRVRRVVSSQKSNSFANSDFTYEDLERRKPEKDDNSILGEESVNGIKCKILQSIPKDKDSSQYGKVVSWIAVDSLLPLKTEYYDHKEKLIKLFEVKEQKQIDSIWTAMVTVMNNLETGHKTKTVVKKAQYNRGVSDDIFSEKYLEHAN